MALLSDKLIRRFTIYGFLFGLCFPLIALSIDILHKDMGFYLEDIIRIHSITPIHYVVDLAPIILGGTAFFIGQYIMSLEKENIKTIESELEKSRKYAEYTEHLINGEYLFDINFGQGGEHLKESLEKLRDNLVENEEREKKQTWTSNGLAKFIEVLRSDVNDLIQLSDRIISNLVKYIEANQGAMYLLEEGKEGEENYLRQVSTFAFSKKKYKDKNIKPGEGLVGQAFLEKETIYLKEIPDDYIRITSGLGEAKPSSLLIVPLMINEEIFGVIELASFKVFDDFEIEFIEKLAESIAATVSSIRTSEITNRLLKESQIQTEQMRSQEEEMRQNMEELTATQEEMERKEHEYQKKIRDLEDKLKEFS